MSIVFTYLPVASPLHDELSVAHLLAAIEPLLISGGGARADGAAARSDCPVAYVVLTGGTERTVLERRQARAATGVDEPLLLVAHPGHNSLPSCLEILAREQADGGTGRIVFLAGDPEDVPRLREAARLAGVALGLRRARLGAIGEPSDWLVASSHDAATVRASWGLELVAVPIAELTSRLASVPVDGELSCQVVAGARRCEVSMPEVERASALRQALAELVAAYRLDGVTVRCFDLVTGLRTSGCLALSQLADDGIAAGCEGDIPSAIALLWLQRLTGEPGWMANPARLALAGGELTLAHCTVPRRLVADYSVKTHFESGLGVALAGELARGPVTLLRIGGPQLEKLWLAEGELVDTPREPGLCRTQAVVRTAPDALEELLRAPLGNHVVLIRGHRAAELRASHELLLRHPGGSGDRSATAMPRCGR